MANRKTLMTIGTVILIPAVVLSILPFLADHTRLINALPDFHLTFRGTMLARLATGMGGNRYGSASPWLWAVAGVAELVLMVVSLVIPKPKTHKITYKG